MLHYHKKRVAVTGHDGNLSDESEHRGDDIGEPELGQMLQVEEESVPGRSAEAFSRDSHVCKCELVDIITNLLNAPEAAVGASYHRFDDWVLA